MRQIRTTLRFEKRLEEFIAQHPGLSTAVESVMRLIALNHRNTSLKTHKLKGFLKGCYAARVSYEYRLVFLVDKHSVCFLDVGTHDDVYR